MYQKVSLKDFKNTDKVVWKNKIWKWFEYNGMYFDRNFSGWMIERKLNIPEKLDGHQISGHNI